MEDQTTVRASDRHLVARQPTGQQIIEKSGLDQNTIVNLLQIFGSEPSGALDEYDYKGRKVSCAICKFAFESGSPDHIIKL